jgi:hypothetical protein
MSEKLSRRSALKIAAGASFVAGWFVAGCSGESEIDPTIKTDKTGKTAEESLRGKVGRKGPTAPPAPTQRLKGGPE